MAEHQYYSYEMVDTIYVSSDLINWNILKDCLWGTGTEPLASVFFNKQSQACTVIRRPFGVIRAVGYSETKDWKNFTEFHQCLNVDSCDEKLSEIYGMYAFEYDGEYIGLLLFS